MAEWISVKDRLPENEEHVLVWEPNLDKNIFARYNEQGEYWWSDKHLFVFPTHWMPLPEPPKGE